MSAFCFSVLGAAELRIERVLRSAVHGEDGRGSGELVLSRRTGSGGCKDGFAPALSGHFSAKDCSEWGGAAKRPGFSGRHATAYYYLRCNLTLAPW